jgi:hypothetical protein
LQKSETEVNLKPRSKPDCTSPVEIKKPSHFQGLFHGAGEEGRTPDLMLGNDTTRKKAGEKVDETRYFSQIIPATHLFLP